MKELTIEEKAKAYDNALEIAKGLYAKDAPDSLHLERMFPALKENGDEEIRTKLLNLLKELLELGGVAQDTWSMNDCEQFIAWLEKQRSKDNDEDVDILHRFSFYSYKDEPNVLYLSGLYVNEECRNKGIGTKILEVADEVAKSLNCHVIRLKTKKDSNAERLYQTHGYNSLAVEERGEIWLEKQCEQKPVMIQLKFKVGDVIKRKNYSLTYTVTKIDASGFQLDGGHWLKLDRMSEFELVKQNPADNIEPKFKIGDWITNGIDTKKIIGIELKNENYLFENSTSDISLADSISHLWTIEDAKSGDVLVNQNGEMPFIFKECKDKHIYCYCGYTNRKDIFFDRFVNSKGEELHWLHLYYEQVYPATKEQRDLLFQKMHEAGYEWNADKKELKKIDDEEYNGEDYGIDSLYHAQRILEKTLGKVEGYQTDDGILAHQCAISAIKKLYEQKPWSEEDEKIKESIITGLEMLKDGASDKSLIALYNKKIDWLKSLKYRYTWKPSDEQMRVLHWCMPLWVEPKSKAILELLIDDLKKLREE